MKFRVGREKLLKALQRVNNLVGSRSTMAVLSNVLLEADGGVLRLTTSDVETRITTTVECGVESSGATTAPVKKFLSLVSFFTGDELVFESDEADHVRLECGTSHFTLLGLPAADFPEEKTFEPLRTFRMRSGDFKLMLNSVAYAVSAEDSRKALTGVLFMVQDGVCTLVATDGKRMAVQEKAALESTGADGESVVPLKGINELRRLLDSDGELEVRLGEKQCQFVSGGFVLSSKLIDGKYPDYRRVIPQGCEHRVEIEAAKLLSKIVLVQEVLSDSSSFVVLSVADGKLKISGSSNEIGEGTDEMDVKLEGEPFEVSFKPKFLSDPLGVVPVDKIVLRVNDPANPVALEGGEGFLYVIMPIHK